MTFKQLLAGTSIVAALGAVAYVVGGRGGKIPHSNIQAMTFPAGVDSMTGDDHGRLRHDIYLRVKGVDDKLVPCHLIADKDFKHASAAEKKAWLIDETLRDAEQEGLACVHDDGSIFSRPVYAQKHCIDCGGCVSWTCPTHFIEGDGCSGPGSTCASTVICCDAPCVPSC